MNVEYPPWFLGSLATLTFLLFVPTLFTRVPYYPTDSEVYSKIEELVKDAGAKSFLDIGSGFGGLLVYLGKRNPDLLITGVEISPLAFLLSWLRFSTLGPRNVKIRFKSFWKVDFSEFDFVYAFLAPPPMEAIWEKVSSEMREDSVFVTNTFEVPAKETEVIDLEDNRQSRLYVFSMAQFRKTT